MSGAHVSIHMPVAPHMAEAVCPLLLFRLWIIVL